MFAEKITMTMVNDDDINCMKRFNLTIILLFFMTLMFPLSLYADNLRFIVGLWAGNLNNELDPRFKNDDFLIGGPDRITFGRYNLDWSGKSNFTFFPASLQYFYQTPVGKFVFGASYVRFTPNYRYSGVGFGPSISLISHDKYYESNFDGDIGFELNIRDRIFITPRAGLRRHTKEFRYKETFYSSDSYGYSLNSPFHAGAIGGFAGIELLFRVTKSAGIVYELRQSTPVLGSIMGDMSFDRLSMIFNQSGGYFYSSTNTIANMQTSFVRHRFGFQYSLFKDMHFQIGYMNERTQTSYPGYYSMPVVISTRGDVGSGFAVYEYLTNYIYYKQNQLTDAGSFYTSVIFDLDMSANK